MLSRWNEADAARHTARSGPAGLGRRVYASRLLGAQSSLVLHGGGNTSMKAGGVLYVKSSGSDLAQVREEDFAALDLSAVLALRAADSLDNAGLRAGLARAALRSGPGASIESLMHALLPWPFVDHTHADAVLAIVDTHDGADVAARLFGELAPLVPFHPSGFALARACDAVYRGRAGTRTIGLILLNHGVVAFGHDARESYENMLALVTRAEEYLASRGAWALPSDPRPFAWRPLDIARLRARMCIVAGHPLLLAALEGPSWQAFARRADLPALCAAGPATPQHAVFLRARTMAGTDIDGFARDYAAAVHATHPCIAQEAPAEAPGFDFAPRALVDPELGAWVAASSPGQLRMARDIAQQDMEIKTRASGHGGYVGLPVAENIAAEIHYGGHERRLRASDGPGTSLLGQAVLIRTGARTERLRAAYANAGAGVFTDGALEPAAVVRDTVRQLGGIDVLVIDAHDRAMLEEAAPVLAASPHGGHVVVSGAAANAGALLRRCEELGVAVAPLPEGVA